MCKYERYSLVFLVAIMVSFSIALYVISKKYEVKEVKREIIVPEKYLDETI